MNRRSFMGWMAALLHAVVALVVTAPVIAFVLDPLRRRRQGAGAAPFIRVAALDALPPGRPVRVAVFAQRRDSFIQHPRTRVGEVWLMRRDGASGSTDGVGVDAGGTPLVRAWQTICPHLGCGVEYAPQRRRFACPCHTSAFALDGSRQFGPSPRDMDALDVRIADAQGQRWVEIRYQQFRTGVADRVVV